MANYLDPKNHLAFKRVFGEHKHLCMSLINSMLPFENPIVSIEYQTGELIPELADLLRNTIVDVRCTDSEGKQFIVEMQMYWSESFKKRVLLNASKAYVMQLDKSKKFDLLQPVYALSFVNECFENAPEMANEYFHHYKIVNVKDTEKQIKGLEFVFIELPKFKPHNRAEKKLHDLWLRFLTEIDEQTKEAPPELLNNELTREALNYMQRGAYTKEELAFYDRITIDLMTEHSIISDLKKKIMDAEKGRAEGEAKGRAEGEIKGLAKGRAEGEIKGLAKGLEKGKVEEKMQTVINLYNANSSVDFIANITKLTNEQITEILKQNNINC